jgi:hypothetical protein
MGIDSCLFLRSSYVTAGHVIILHILGTTAVRVNECPVTQWNVSGMLFLRRDKQDSELHAVWTEGTQVTKSAYPWPK